MHRLAPALLLLTLVACSDSDSSCGDTCQAAEERLGLSKRTVHDSRQKTFQADGTAYTLLRVEYGDTEECDLFDDCSYSTYCGFVVDGKDYPLEVHWVTDADALFDPADLCDGGDLDGCELPGHALAIVDDDDFVDWAYDVDPDEDPLGECVSGI